MSDLCSNELEDLVWDDFYQSDGHISPHSVFGRAADDSILGDSHKKPAVGYVNLGREQGESPSVNKRTYMMLENDSRCNTPSCISPSSPKSSSIRQASSVASENTASSHHASKINKTDPCNNKICTNDTILNDKRTAVQNRSFDDALDDINHTENNLDFLEKTENKDSSELLYYGWPEIGNFEDVDRMFRSCDLTFGLGASREDELGWFASADNIGGSGDIDKSDFEFPYPEPETVEYTSQNHGSSKSDIINDFSMAGEGFWTSEKSDSYMYFVNGPAMANHKDRFIPREQINDNKNQVKLQVQSTGKRKEQYIGNGSFNYKIGLQNKLMQLPVSSMPSKNSNSDLTSVNPAPCAVKSEAHGLRSPSSRDPSHASIQLKDDPKFPVTAPVAGKGEKLHNREGKQVQYSGDKSENDVDPEGVSLVIPEVGSSGIQVELKISSGIVDVSQEATSFRQLQLVMEQLDLRTKICIRDSLYRLARSAEQRHNQTKLNGNSAAEIDGDGAFFPPGTNKFMDMEADTNPIDRSIAHLLFHRPSGTPNTLRAYAYDAKNLFPLFLHASIRAKSKQHHSLSLPKQVHRSIIGLPVMVENSVICEENVSKIEDTDR